MTDDTRTDLLAACGEAIEGLGRLRVAIERTGDDQDQGFYRYDLLAMVEITHRMLRQIESEITRAPSNVNSPRSS